MSGTQAAAKEAKRSRKREREAEGGEDEEEELVTERKQPVPKREVLAENGAVWEQLYKQLRLGAGSLGWFGWC